MTQTDPSAVGIERLIARILPADLRVEGSDLARQARLVFFFALVICVAALSYMSLYVVLSMPVSALGAGIAAVGAPVTLIVLRRTRSVTAAGHALSAVVVVALDLVSLGTGGLSSGATAWFILAPVITAMIVGRHAAIAWLPIVAAQFGAMWWLDAAGHTPPSQLPDFFDRAYKFAVPTGLMLAFFAVAWSYERARDRSMDALARSHADLSEARDAAESAHAESRLVLDNVAQGMMIVGSDGKLMGGASSVIAEWFGEVQCGSPMWDMFDAAAPDVAAWLELGWSDLHSEWLPTELAVAQLPARCQVGERTLRLEYRLLEDGSGRVLMVLTDITAQLEAERAEAAQREMLALFTRLLRNPQAVTDFLGEARRLSDLLGGDVRAVDQRAVQERRWLHTLKGNASLFGLESFASWLHQLEEALDARGEGLTADERSALVQRWEEVEARVRPLVDDRREDRVTVERPVFDAAVADAEGGLDGPQLAGRMRRWTWDRVSDRLELLAERGAVLAERLDKGGVRFEVDCELLMHPPTPEWSTFWNALVHVLRNAIDHGIEDHDERRALGKAGGGVVRLAARERDSLVVVEVGDDGRGIDWASMRDRARRLGLPAETAGDLEAALFHDGLSTRETVTETSGRGVGMAAVREACEALDGRVEIESEAQGGTTMRFVFPRRGVDSGHDDTVAAAS